MGTYSFNSITASRTVSKISEIRSRRCRKSSMESSDLEKVEPIRGGGKERLHHHHDVLNNCLGVLYTVQRKDNKMEVCAKN